MGEVRAKKSLGQHFLTDMNIAKRISDSLYAEERHGCPKSSAGDEKSAGSGKNVGLENAGHGNTMSENVSLGNTAAENTVLGSAIVENVSLGNAAVFGSDSGLSGTCSSELSGACSTELSDTCSSELSDTFSFGLPAAGSAELKPKVLEVGCGTGVLTRFLLERDDIELWGAEVDRESVDYLRRNFPDFSPRLIEGDFLAMPLGELFPAGVGIIGNFPYNISSQIFFRILEFRDLVPEAVGMVQREVAQRIAEPPGSKTYGILSVLLQAWYDIEYLFTVSEHVFDPPPKVKSAVIRLKRNGVRSLDCNEKLFVKVVKAAFGQRRKMLRNPLKAAFGDFGGRQNRFFTLRAEVLSVADFVELTNWVEENSH